MHALHPYICVAFLVFLYVRFLSLFLALQQAQVHRKRISLVSCIAFSSLEVLPVLHLGRFHTSPIMVFYLSGGLAMSIPKSPSLLKSEFGYKSYRSFSARFFCLLFRRVFRRRRVCRRKVSATAGMIRSAPVYSSE